MRWIGRRQSINVEDRRGMGGPIAIGGGLIGVIALLVNFLLGGDGSSVPLPGGQELTAEQKARQDSLVGFVRTVLAETEDVWNEYFPQNFNESYSEPTLVIFSGSTNSGCGYASAQTGPFYCPADQKLYIDLSFYDDLQNRFGAGGDFAMAYVIAHEVGHHIQTLLGTSQKVHRLRQQLSQEEYNKYSVMLELQADFLAGMWARYTANKNLLEPGDFEEALRAANAIGDDRLQRESRGEVDPESFTHGTSAQRMYWFRKGYETGDYRYGDTFNDASLKN
jgi:uncharacterized protein